MQLKESEDKIVVLSRERDQLIKQRDSALQEAQLWRSELAKARERAVILEAAVVRADEKVRVTEADAEARIKDAEQKGSAAMKDKQELLAYLNVLQAQLQRSAFLFIYYQWYDGQFMHMFGSPREDYLFNSRDKWIRHACT